VTPPQNWQTVMTKEGRQFFSAKIGVTPSVAAPGDTHPSDATDPGFHGKWTSVTARPPRTAPAYQTSAQSGKARLSYWCFHNFSGPVSEAILYPPVLKDTRTKLYQIWGRHRTTTEAPNKRFGLPRCCTISKWRQLKGDWG